jgi:hypothetical protein
LTTSAAQSSRYRERWYVNDPGFNRAFYQESDVVGWRIFKMVNATLVPAEPALFDD